LPGITRDSILSVAADLGYKTSEEMISIDDWRDGVASGEITEILLAVLPLLFLRLAKQKAPWALG
jgi:hypothetical protein